MKQYRGVDGWQNSQRLEASSGLSDVQVSVDQDDEFLVVYRRDGRVLSRSYGWSAGYWDGARERSDVQHGAVVPTALADSSGWMLGIHLIAFEKDGRAYVNRLFGGVPQSLLLNSDATGAGVPGASPKLTLAHTRRGAAVWFEPDAIGEGQVQLSLRGMTFTTWWTWFFDSPVVVESGLGAATLADIQVNGDGDGYVIWTRDDDGSFDLMFAPYNTESGLGTAGVITRLTQQSFSDISLNVDDVGRAVVLVRRNNTLPASVAYYNDGTGWSSERTISSNSSSTAVASMAQDRVLGTSVFVWREDDAIAGNERVWMRAGSPLHDWSDTDFGRTVVSAAEEEVSGEGVSLSNGHGLMTWRRGGTGSEGEIMATPFFFGGDATAVDTVDCGCKWGCAGMSPNWDACSDPATVVSAGHAHSCVVLTDGHVSCWGSNEYGQLGDGTYYSRSTPAIVPNVSSATQVVTSSMGTCAVVAGGQVRCWGREAAVDGTHRSWPSAGTVLRNDGQPLAGITRIDAFGPHACGIRDNGELWCWGNGPGVSSNVYAYQLADDKGLVDDALDVNSRASGGDGVYVCVAHGSDSVVLGKR